MLVWPLLVVLFNTVLLMVVVVENPLVAVLIVVDIVTALIEKVEENKGEVMIEVNGLVEVDEEAIVVLFISPGTLVSSCPI